MSELNIGPAWRTRRLTAMQAFEMSRDGRDAIVVVGAGIVGVCTAWHLLRRGANVMLIDRDAPGRGCSYGNAGAVGSGSIVPLATPGIMRDALRMIINPAATLRGASHFRCPGNVARTLNRKANRNPERNRCVRDRAAYRPALPLPRRQGARERRNGLDATARPWPSGRAGRAR